MLVILRKIPSTVLKAEIIDFIETALNNGVWGLLGKKAYISSVEIIHRRMIGIGNRRGPTETDAVLRIEPDKAGLRLIRRLNGKSLKGKRIGVRMFHFRNWHNDRRAVGFNPRIAFKDRRITDRRNNYEIIKGQGLQAFTSDIVKDINSHSVKSRITQAYSVQSKHSHKN